MTKEPILTKVYWKSIFHEIAAKIGFYLVKCVYDLYPEFNLHCTDCGLPIDTDDSVPIIRLDATFLDEERTKFNGTWVSVLCVVCLAKSNYTVKQIDDIRLDK